MKKFKIIISGGGTGGHIFPAIAIAKQIEKNNRVEFLFVGAKKRMEMEKIPEAGYNIKGLWISGLQRRITIKNLFFPIKILHSLFKSYLIIKSFNPDLVIGTGGFASGPILFMSSLRKIPSIIQEQNSYPGITNRILSTYVDKICVAYDNMSDFFPKKKIIFTGNPIRNNIIEVDKNDKQINDNKTNKITVLVIGGSLGAKTINQAINERIGDLKKNNIKLIWQTGKSFYEEAKNAVSKINYVDSEVHSFIKNMHVVYSLSNIIISRAGAIAISELSCVGKPTILVPSPNVSENHQFKNAQSLVNKKAALIVEDIEANRKLVDTILKLVNDEGLQKEISKNIKKLEIKDASVRISEVAMKLLK